MGVGLRLVKRDIANTETLLAQLDNRIHEMRRDLRDTVKVYNESKVALVQLKKMQEKEERILKHKLRGYIQDNVNDAQELMKHFESADF